MTTLKAAIPAPSRNGSRHPQAAMSAALRTLLIRAPMPEPTSMPATPPSSGQAAIKPRRLSGACSASMTMEPVNSPPSDSPWTIRNATSSSAARSPIWA